MVDKYQINEESLEAVRRVFAEMLRVVNVSGAVTSSSDKNVAAASLTNVYFEVENERRRNWRPPG